MCEAKHKQMEHRKTIFLHLGKLLWVSYVFRTAHHLMYWDILGHTFSNKRKMLIRVSSSQFPFSSKVMILLKRGTLYSIGGIHGNDPRVATVLISC